MYVVDLLERKPQCDSGHTWSASFCSEFYAGKQFINDAQQ